MHNLPDTVKITGCTDLLASKRFTTEIVMGKTVAEILEANHVVLTDCLNAHVYLNGEPVDRELWATIIPKANDLVVFRVIPTGGDDKNPMHTVLSIAVIAMSLYVPTLGPFANLGRFGSAMLSAGLSTVGMMAVNAIAPPPTPSMDKLSGTDDIARVSASFSGSNNPFNPYGPVPEVLGTAKIVPPLAAEPYVETVDSDTYIRQLFAVGHGNIFISDLKIGETELGVYEGVTTNLVKPGDEFLLLKSVVSSEAVGIPINYSDGWVERTTEADTEEIRVNISFPTGLRDLIGVVYSHAGDRMHSIAVELDVQIAPVGTEDWTYGRDTTLNLAERSTDPFEFPALRYEYDDATGTSVPIVDTLYWGVGIDKYDGTLVNFPVNVIDTSEMGRDTRNSCPSWLYPIAVIAVYSTQSVVTQATDIWRDFPTVAAIGELPDFAVTTNGTNTVTVAAGSLEINNIYRVASDSLSPIRKTYTYRVTSGQYKVRVKRVTADRDDARYVDQMYWDGLQSLNTDTPPVDLNDTDITLLEMRIRASDQLDSVVDTFNCIARNESITAYDPETETWVADTSSSSPADLYRYVLQSPANKKAVADSKIDLDELIDWHGQCSDTIKAINNAGVAVDKGSGTVGIPVTGHGIDIGKHIVIYGTDSYNGEHVVESTTTTNEIVITATYAAETFDSSTDSVVVPGLRYNKVIDYQSSVDDILIEIAAAGKASKSYFDGQFSVVQDKPKTTHIQHFSPRNSWGFNSTKTFYETPHAWKCRFINELEDYRQDLRIVYADGYTSANATEFEELELPGSTHPVHVYMLARFHMAVAQLRPEVHRFYTDVEHIVCTRGDYVKISHDVPNWKENVSTGRIKSLTLSGSDITHIELDEICTFVETLIDNAAATDEGGGVVGIPVAGHTYTTDDSVTIENTTNYDGTYTVLASSTANSVHITKTYAAETFDGISDVIHDEYCVRIRLNDMTSSYHNVVFNLGDQNTVELSTPVNETASGINVGDLVTFGERLSETVDMLVKEIRPGGDLTAQITVVDLAPAVHTADSGTIPAFDSNIQKSTDPAKAIGAPVISGVRSDESVMPQLPDGSLASVIVVSFSTSTLGLLASLIESTTVIYRRFDSIRLDGSAATDIGGGVVGVPVTGHPYSTDDIIVITGTDNYDGTYDVLATSTTDVVHITATYVAETFDGVDDSIYRFFDTPDSGWKIAPAPGVAGKIVLPDVEDKKTYDIRAYYTLNIDGIRRIGPKSDELLHTVEGKTIAPDPPDPIDVTILSGKLVIFALVEPPDDPTISAIEVWKNTTTSFPGGDPDYTLPVEFGHSFNRVTLRDSDVVAGTTYYYWFGSVDAYGNQSTTQEGPHSGTANPATIATDVTQEDGTTPLTDNDILNENQAAEDIVAGVVTGSTFRTAASGKRFVVSKDTNEAEFWGNRGDTTIEKLATIGLSTVGSDITVIDLGGSAHNNRAMNAVSNNAHSVIRVDQYGSGNGIYSENHNVTGGNGIWGGSTKGVGVWGYGNNSGGIGVKAVGGSSADYALYATTSGSGTALYGSSTSGLGLHIDDGDAQFDEAVDIDGTLTMSSPVHFGAAGDHVTRQVADAGHQVGSYNITASETHSSPIYTVGTSYNPGLTSLNNMYGIGYASEQASFINSTDLGSAPTTNAWGLYVAADGNARIFLDASNGNIHAANGFACGGAFWLNGTGSPEGAVAAPVGSLYTRLDGGANTSLYVKESGTGNTGWAAK